MLNIVYIVLLTPLFISFFWGIELLMSSFNKYAIKRHLAFFMLCGFVSFVSGITFFAKNFVFYNAIYVPVVFFALSQFPSFYVYMYSLTSEKKLSFKIYIHYLYPFIAMLSAGFIHWLLMSSEESITFVSKYLTGTYIDNHKFKLAFIIDRIYKNTFIVFGVYYYIKVNIRVKQHRKKIKDYFSNTELVNLKWMNIFNVLFLLTLLSGIFFHSMNRDFFITHPTFLIFPFASLTLFFWVVGHFGSKQALIFKNPINEENNLPELSETNIENLKHQLLDLMENKRPYLKPDLTLAELSAYLATNRSYLSKLINNCFNQNFNQFINNYRLEEAKKYLTKDSKISMLDVCELCGFSSYHTFNRCFKEKYNTSPTIFKKKCES